MKPSGRAGQEISLIGLTRFSVVNPSTMWQFAQTREADLEAARTHIFAPERLKHRFMLFETLTLPSMAALADQCACFWHVVLVSPGLPAPWRDRLDCLAAGAGDWCQIRQVADHESIAKAASLAAVELRGVGASSVFASMMMTPCRFTTSMPHRKPPPQLRMAP